ncbi:MAG: hypothetical protein MZW92_49095 [Comamonadaceae bacterium]|nr:hypothetical protein [Comamonadaceae bacterium]
MRCMTSAKAARARGVDQVLDRHHHRPFVGRDVDRRLGGSCRAARGEKSISPPPSTRQPSRQPAPATPNTAAATHRRTHAGQPGHLAPQQRAGRGAAHQRHLVDRHAARAHPVGQRRLRRDDQRVGHRDPGHADERPSPAARPRPRARATISADSAACTSVPMATNWSRL